MKIKITEYFPEATAAHISHHQRSTVDSASSSDNHHTTNANAATVFSPNGSDPARGNSGTQPFGMLTSNPALSGNPSAAAGNGQKLYTIQRVNGNGGNGKTDGIGGGHRHTLEDSDRVKKNSVHRYLLKKSKDEKKVVVVSDISLPVSLAHQLVASMSKKSRQDMTIGCIYDVQSPVSLVNVRDARGVHAYVTYLPGHLPALLSLLLSHLRE